MSRLDAKVRMATDDEAPIVEKLVSEVLQFEGWQPKFDVIFPHWLVAEIAGEIVGTINIRVSLPISTVELLAMDPGLSRIDRTRVAMLLVDSAVSCCAAAGASGASTMIPDGMESYQEVLEDKGYFVGNHGTIMFGRIR